LAAVAAKAFEAPMAAVILIEDGHTRVRAAVGSPAPKIPNEAGFVERLVRQGEIVVLGDVAADRLEAEGLPAGTRFCAAAPLGAPGDEPQGALCVFDTRPQRDFGASRRALLAELAAAVGEAVRLDRPAPSRPAAGVGALSGGDEALYRLLAENSNDAIACFDASGVFTYLSPAVGEVLGYDPAELLGRSPTDFIHPDDLSGVIDIFRARAAAGPDAPSFRFEYRAYRKDGAPIWLEANPRALYDAEGRHTGFQDAVRDITARKQAEFALAASEQRHSLIASHVTDLILRSNLSMQQTYASPSVAQVTGFTAEELIAGTPRFPERVHPDDAPGARAQIHRVAEGAAQGDVRFSFRFQRRDGEWIWLESHPTLVRDANGEPVEILDVLRDVSARHRLEASLREARDSAEAAARAKADFMANMSHEIRTPLTSIIGYTRILAARTDLDPKAAHYVQRMAAAGDALMSLVNDVLDFSRLAAGQFDIAPREVSPRDLLKGAAQMVAPQAEAKGLTLTVAVDDLPDLVKVDPDRLRQIVLNLVGNAVKFTAEGEVTVTADYEAGEKLRVAVRDTGPGISQEHQAGLFDRFTQVDASSSRRHGGAGLGLAICKGLVEAMGGEISVESGAGAVFTFVLPAPRASA
jgi:PAS domain S-box-containing protein